MSFENKYKDRQPEDTVNCIKHFFYDRGFSIQEDSINQSLAGTWSCALLLYYENHYVLHSNGKGVTKEFCLASGYAELYERFCNKMLWLSNPIIMEAVAQLRDYDLDPQEIILSREDAFSDYRIKNFFEGFGSDIYKYLETVYPQYIGVPYTPIRTDDEIKYFDPRLINIAFTSSGMAAGNTLEEALIQSISELFEHYIAGQWYFNKLDSYDYLPNSYVTNPTLKEYIQRIEQDNKKLYLLDFSYSYQVPVIAAFVINYNTHSTTINFGCAPCIDIAIERTITEMYQNVFTLDVAKKIMDEPYKTATLEDLLLWDDQPTYGMGFIETIIQELKEEEHPNWNVFLQDDNDTNEFLLRWYRMILENNHFHIWYRNNSLSNEMFAVQCFSNFSNHELGISNILLYAITKEEKSKIINVLIKLYNLVQNYKVVEQLDYNIITTIGQQLDELTPLGMQCLFTLAGNEWLLPYENGSCSSFSVIQHCLNNTIETVLPQQIITQWLYPYLTHYLFLYRYKRFNKYSKEEIQTIMNFYKEQYTESDYQCITNKYYLLEHILFIPWKQTIQSKEYKHFLMTLIK